MKYKVTLNDKVYEVEVEAGKAVLLDEYEACAPAQRQLRQPQRLLHRLRRQRWI